MQFTTRLSLIYMFLHVCGITKVVGLVTVTTSAVTGIPNQQALTLRCGYTTDEPAISQLKWSRKTRSNPDTFTPIFTGTVSPQSATFQNTWQNKGVFRGDYTSTLDIELPANHVTSSYAGSYRCEVTGIGNPGQGIVDASVLYAPTISGFPSTYQVIESSRLQIDCSRYTTVGNPSTTSYTWTYGGSTVSSGAVLDISSISRSQAGQYTCTATNTLTPTGGSQQQGTATGQVNVDVQYAPTISSFPSTYRVIEASRLQIDCSSYTTVGNPSTTSYTWTYKGSTVSSGAVLDISSISRSQAGQYTCTATNTLTPTGGSQQQGTARGQVNVDVQYSPSILGLPSVKNVTELSHLQIDCSSYTTVGNPSTTSYTWTYGGSTVSSGAVLDISSISRSQAGQYTCTATNTLTPTGGSQQQGTATGQVNIDVQYGPGSSVTVSPQGSLERVEGSGPFTATCTAVCNPSCSISWRKGSTNLPPGQLNISNISRTDQGDYTCQAQNGIGGPGQKMFTFTVYYLDIPGLTIDKHAVMENDTVNLKCSVDSNPIVEMTIKNVDNDTVVVQRSTNTLSYTIQRVQCLHNGTYVCSADNTKTGGISTTSNTLYVPCTPRHDFRKQLNVVLAKNKNETAVFVADVIANPAPNFTWYGNNGDSKSAISNRTDYRVNSTAFQSTLEIHITGTEDYGDYEVVVQNTQGSYRLKFTLTAKTPPSVPENFQMLTAPGATVVSLSWTSSFNGGGEQTFTLEYRADTESQWKTWKERIEDPGRYKEVKENVTGLTPLTKYYFQVYGVNQHGDGDKAIVSATTTTKPSDEKKSNGPEMNTALVAGWVVAAILLVVIILAVIILLYKRGVLRTKAQQQQCNRTNERNRPQEGSIHLSSVGPSQTTNPYSGLDHSDDNRQTYSELRKYETIQTQSTHVPNVYEGLEDVPPTAYEKISMQVYENTGENRKDPFYENT